MPNFKIKVKLKAIPLKLRSLEIYVLNFFLSLLIKKKKLRTSRLVISMDTHLTNKREKLNQKTEIFIKETFLAHRTD